MAAETEHRVSIIDDGRTRRCFKQERLLERSCKSDASRGGRREKQGVRVAEAPFRYVTPNLRDSVGSSLVHAKAPKVSYTRTPPIRTSRICQTFPPRISMLSSNARWLSFRVRVLEPPRRGGNTPYRGFPERGSRHAGSPAQMGLEGPLSPGAGGGGSTVGPRGESGCWRGNRLRHLSQIDRVS
ncbi:hypothetical protein VUR80DRAFT_8907 [Thermomyces stellatus]